MHTTEGISLMFVEGGT